MIRFHFLNTNEVQMVFIVTSLGLVVFAITFDSLYFVFCSSGRPPPLGHSGAIGEIEPIGAILKRYPIQALRDTIDTLPARYQRRHLTTYGPYAF